MNDQQFERDTEALRHRGYVSFVEAVRARDTAQREALAQLQAEMPDLRANMTKALDLLQVLTSTKYTHRAFVDAVDEADEMLEQLRGKVVLKGQAEQQEAVPRLVSYSEEMATCTLNYKGREYYFTLDGRSDEEAQGAQAGDERVAKAIYDADRSVFMSKREYAELHHTTKARLLKMARAALATQPAAGEPVAWECYEPASEWNGYKGRDYLSREKPKGCSVRAVPLGRIAAPPAAAHGDEAATLAKALSLLWEATNFLPRGGSLDGRVSAFLAQHAPEPVASAAAIRAQGDGETTV